MFNFKIAGLSLIFLFIVSGCSKNNTSQIPNVLVDITVYTTDPQFAKLNAIGGWVYITGGVHGIIVYHQNVDVFMAYDRDCPYNPGSANSTVQVDSSNVLAWVPTCGSKFLLYDGSVTKGPAAYGLKVYPTTVSGSAVHIYNQ